VCPRGHDHTRFSTLRLSLALLYRVTPLADAHILPLVPFVELGLDAVPWWESGTGTTRSGLTPGWHYAVGTAIWLDGLDPVAMRTLAADYGVVHVALLVEYSGMNETGLGAAHKLNLSDRTWAVGLGFEL
jgi:hypothetical protein